MDLLQVTTLARSKCFTVALLGIAKKWIRQIKSETVISWGQLSSMFMCQFQGARKYATPLSCFASIKHEPNETHIYKWKIYKIFKENFRALEPYSSASFYRLSPLFSQLLLLRLVNLLLLRFLIFFSFVWSIYGLRLLLLVSPSESVGFNCLQYLSYLAVIICYFSRYQNVLLIVLVHFKIFDKRH